jgi:hypothetical protein
MKHFLKYWALRLRFGKQNTVVMLLRLTGHSHASFRTLWATARFCNALVTVELPKLPEPSKDSWETVTEGAAHPVGEIVTVVRQMSATKH